MFFSAAALGFVQIFIDIWPISGPPEGYAGGSASVLFIVTDFAKLITSDKKYYVNFCLGKQIARVQH